VSRRAKAEVECAAETAYATVDPARAHAGEIRHHLRHRTVVARVDDEDIVRTGLAASERLEATPYQLGAADRRQDNRHRRCCRDGRICSGVGVVVAQGKSTRYRMLPLRRPSSRPSRTMSGARSALVRAFGKSRASRAHDLSTRSTGRRCIPALR
jgi:hypothetical protein